MTDNAPIDTQLTQDTPIVNPSASPSTQPSSLPPPPSTSADVKPPSQPDEQPKAKDKSKAKSKKTKARPRRRVVASDSDPEEDDAASEGSLTDPSSASDSEPDPDSEEEEEEEVKGSKPQLEKEKETKTKTNEVVSRTEERTLEDSNRGGTSIKGKGKGKAGPNGVKREYTEEETKKYEEMKARRKEKQKAKKAELREIKRKEKESQSGKLAVDSKAVEADEESTVPLVADGSPPPSQPTALPPQNQKGRRGSKSQRRQSVVNDDPKIVPRQGQFWTHDQRSDPHLQQGFSGGGARGLPDWRGRGGFRGRGGRGFPNHTPAFGRFPQQNGTLQGQGQELTAEIPAESEKADGDEPVLAMDRLEKELAKKEKQPSATAVIPPKEKKWGHEAFEQIQTEKDKKAIPSPAMVARGGLRGLPRGRGRGFGSRGGHLGQPFRQPLSSLPFHPANLAATAAAAAAKSATAATSTAPAPASVPTSTATVVSQPPSLPLPKAEEQSTQPDSDDLLGESSQAVTIKLPGSSNTVEVAVVHPPQEQKSAAIAPAPETVSAQVQTPELNASGQAILYTSPVPPPQPIAQQLPPQPSMYPNVTAPSPYPTGSENGSMSSGMSHSQFVPTLPYPQKSHLQQNVVPTPSGYGMGSEFVPSSRPQVHVNGGAAQTRSFYPSAAPRSYPAQRPFYPQQQSYEYQPNSQRGSFSSSGHQQFYPSQPQHVNGYIDGRGSPFNGGSPQPYFTNNGHGQMNYFSPARPSQKISIKPPSSSTSATKTGEKELNGGQPTFATLTSTSGEFAQQATGYYPQHYNPYQQNGYDENGNTNGYYGANGYENWQGVGAQGYAYEGDYGY
ncbi:hypothetical protein I302_103241 [Kwoniella bestiolae CBS 10118]|uniref:Btz domain-containing protein n=1 Tax=Kwoniella bestiolae CBS 10118 TaxID=1296100 RepID=A0A1B9G7U4_9TREE|nr:hypothetical protein I302_01940 [Kwoniella bestiolae CBS 10118]OCF27105.1 hypothetical protein I302_01940 [Kwoniella bestiolae CBS 10118]